MSWYNLRPSRKTDQARTPSQLELTCLYEIICAVNEEDKVDRLRNFAEKFPNGYHELVKYHRQEILAKHSLPTGSYNPAAGHNPTCYICNIGPSKEDNNIRSESPAPSGQDAGSHKRKRDENDEDSSNAPSSSRKKLSHSIFKEDSFVPGNYREPPGLSGQNAGTHKRKRDEHDDGFNIAPSSIRKTLSYVIGVKQKRKRDKSEEDESQEEELKYPTRKRVNLGRRDPTDKYNVDEREGSRSSSELDDFTTCFSMLSPIQDAK